MWTFHQMRDEVLQYAQFLIGEGIQPGDVAALYFQNSGEFMLLVFAAFCIGATTAMINRSSQESTRLLSHNTTSYGRPRTFIRAASCRV